MILSSLPITKTRFATGMDLLIASNSFIANTGSVCQWIKYRVFIRNCGFFSIHCNTSPASWRVTQIWVYSHSFRMTVCSNQKPPKCELITNNDQLVWLPFPLRVLLIYLWFHFYIFWNFSNKKKRYWKYYVLRPLWA